MHAILLTHAHGNATMVASPLPRRFRKTCPPARAFLSKDELPTRGWFKVAPVPLRAGGLAPIEYRLDWEGKNAIKDLPQDPRGPGP